ncbi:MAG: hypothetical protein HY689_00670 [Chloroflexi bacterium]|nr:hypothetical protein [Chloroflexota bacterium]
MRLPAFAQKAAAAVGQLALSWEVVLAATAGLLALNLVLIVLRAGHATPPPVVAVAPAEAIPSPAPTSTATPAARATSTATPAPTSTATPIPSPTPTPLALAAVAPPEGSLPFISAAAPYAIAYPASWSVQPGLVRSSFTGDAFLQIGPAGPFRPSITVLAEPLSGSLTADDYLATHATTSLREVALQPLGPYRAAGTPARLVFYEGTQDGQRVVYVHAFFTTPGRGWVVTLATLPQDLSRQTGTLLWMLDQMTLRQ